MRRNMGKGPDTSFSLSLLREIVTLLYKSFMKTCHNFNIQLVNWACVVTSLT